MFWLKWKNLRLLKRQESGQTLVESAMCATIFILALFTAINVGFSFYARATLQNAVRQAARYAITGNCSAGACFNSGNNNNRLDTILQTVTYYSFDLSPTVTVSCTPASGTGSCSADYGSGTNNAGGPGDFVTISASYNYSPIAVWLWPSGLTFTVSSSFKNESFSPAPTGGS